LLHLAYRHALVTWRRFALLLCVLVGLCSGLHCGEAISFWLQCPDQGRFSELT
jgi:hypothetical protein